MTHVSAAATMGRMELPASIVERQPGEVQYTVLRRVLADENDTEWLSLSQLQLEEAKGTFASQAGALKCVVF
jgi:hypothetical protein